MSGMMRFAGGLALSAFVLASLTQMVGCKKEEPPPPPPKRAPLPPPPPPEPVDLTQLMDSLDGIDARVEFPQEQAPTDADLAENVLRFVSGLASKDGDALRSMMNADGRSVLDQVEQIWWNTEIESARVVMLTAGGGGQVRDASGGLSPEVAALVEQTREVIANSLSDELRAQLPPAMLEQMVGGFGPEELAGLNDNSLRVGLEAAKPMLEPMANGDFSQMGQMMGLPGGMELPQEVQDQFSQMQPMFVAMLEHFDSITAAIENAGNNVVTSDSSATLVTALQDATGSYVLMWDAQKFDDGWFFAPLAATDELRQSVRDWDGGSLNDYRIEVVAAPLPDLPDADATDSSTPNNSGDGGGSTTSGG